MSLHEADTPLHDAASRDDVSAVDALLSNGADIEASDEDGQTPLFLGALVGSVDACKVLIERGADIHAWCGTSALHMAAGAGEPELVRFLIDRGADVHRLSDHGRTAMHEAVSSGRLEALERLVAEGGETEIHSLTGLTPLHEAVESRAVNVVRYLLDKKNVAVDPRDNLGRTPLRLLVERLGLVEEAREAPLRKDEAAVLELLRAHGADLDAADNEGVSPRAFVATGSCGGVFQAAM
jgi:ankyrin repeat protein